jgi:hypothetical protein
VVDKPKPNPPAAPKQADPTPKPPVTSKPPPTSGKPIYTPD